MPEYVITPDSSIDVIPTNVAFGVIPNLVVQPVITASIGAVPVNPLIVLNGTAPSGTTVVKVTPLAAVEVACTSFEIIDGILVMLPPPKSVDIVPRNPTTNYTIDDTGRVYSWNEVDGGPQAVLFQVWSDSNGGPVTVKCYIWSTTQGGSVPTPAFFGA